MDRAVEKLKHIRGRSWVLEAQELIPVYFLAEKRAVLLDSGLEDPDRALLDALFSETGIRVRAVIGSHTHRDHSGNHRYLQETHCAEIILNDMENCIGSSWYFLGGNYNAAPAYELERLLPDMRVQADRIYTARDTAVEVDGAVFGLVPLPGHTVGHTGIVTPDGVFYIADALMTETALQRAKLPSDMDWKTAAESRRRLLDMHFDRYILAHKGVFAGIDTLVQENIADRQDRVRNALSWMEAGRSYSQDEMFALLWTRLELRGGNTLKEMVFEKNAICLLQYLAEEGLVVFARRGGVRYYTRPGEQEPAEGK